MPSRSWGQLCPGQSPGAAHRDPLAEVSTIPTGTFTFVTATDGNHGRGVPWAARNLRQKAMMYMSSGSSRERLDSIRKLEA